MTDVGATQSAHTPTAAVRLNLGSGPHTVRGWVNVDKSWSPQVQRRPRVRRLLERLQIIGPDQVAEGWQAEIVRVDVTKCFPWPDGSVAAIYSSHFLEHLARSEAYTVLERCHRALRPGGIIRLVMPDLEHAARNYLNALEAGDERAADRFVEFLGFAPDLSGNFLRRVAVRLLHRPHQWMYDEASLSHELGQVGFRNVRPASYRQGRIRDVEQLDIRPESFFLEGER